MDRKEYEMKSTVIIAMAKENKGVWMQKLRKCADVPSVSHCTITYVSKGNCLCQNYNFRLLLHDKL
jgi:hypothetical protein